MAKRGRRQKDGLRFHKGNRQWYRVFDGKEEYFGPSGVSIDDATAKSTAEQEWHLHEADQSIPMSIPAHSIEEARREVID